MLHENIVKTLIVNNLPQFITKFGRVNYLFLKLVMVMQLVNEQ